MFLRKSLAPRTSPYSVAPQTGQRSQKAITGRSLSVSLKLPANIDDGMPSPAFVIVAWYASLAP